MTTNTALSFSDISADAPDFFDFVNDPAILAELHKAYAKPTDEESKRHAKDAKSPRAPKAPKAETADEEKSSAREIVVIVSPPGETYAALGDPGYLARTRTTGALPRFGAAVSAACFLRALRAAGKREVTDEVTGLVNTVFDESAYRFDAKEAITAFLGWTNEALGVQLDRATLHARFLRAPKGALSLGYRSPEAHTARASATGFVAGLPNTTRKVLADLAARERAATAEMIDVGNVVSARDNGNPAEYERALTRFAREEPGIAGILRARPDFLDTAYDLAAARLAEVRADMGELSSEADILRAGEIISRRGMPTFEEQIALMNTTPKSN
jgi:hypothetical protein